MDLKTLTLVAVVMSVIISDHESYARPSYSEAWQRYHKSLGLDLVGDHRANDCEQSVSYHANSSIPYKIPKILGQ